MHEMNISTTKMVDYFMALVSAGKLPDSSTYTVEDWLKSMNGERLPKLGPMYFDGNDFKSYYTVLGFKSFSDMIAFKLLVE